MDREDLVVLVRSEKLVVGQRELDSHQCRFDTSEHKKHKRRHDVTHGDRLVIGVGKPTTPATRTGPRLLQLILLAPHHLS